MGVVEFEMDDRELEFLRAEGHDPNGLGRELLEGRVRRLRAMGRMQELESLQRDLGDAVKLVREARDEH